MADKKISALTAATTPLAGTEVLPIVQGGATVKVSVDNLTIGKAVSMSNLTYTGTLTGSTSVINIGSGQVYKDASGNVGVGTTAPQSKFHVSNSGAAGLEFFVNYPGGGVGTYIQSFNRSGGAYTDTAYDAANHSFRTNGTERLLVEASGNATLSTGNLVIGTAGKGIDFSADGQAAGMTSELLDDYEEGTWTPVPVPSSGAITSYTSSGKYVKIGSQITVNFNLTITDVGTASAISNISGLPFANFDVVSTGAGREAGVTGAAWQYFIGASSTAIDARKYDNDPGIATGYIIYGSVTYLA